MKNQSIRNLEGSFKRRAEKLGFKDSSYPNRFHNGQVAVELDPRNSGQILVTWEQSAGFGSKKFRLGTSEESWLDRAFEFAGRKALELSQESLELKSNHPRRRVRRGLAAK